MNCEQSFHSASFANLLSARTFGNGTFYGAPRNFTESYMMEKLVSLLDRSLPTSHIAEEDKKIDEHPMCFVFKKTLGEGIFVRNSSI